MEVWKTFVEAQSERYQLFDCRNVMDQLEQSYEQFNDKHVKGAVFVPAYPLLYDKDKPSEGRHPLPDMNLFHSFVDYHCQGKIPVCYDVSGGIMAARFYFLCDYIGLECYMTHVTDAMMTEKGQLTAESIHQLLTEIPMLKTSVNLDKVVHRYEVMNPDNDVVIIDARENKRFRGVFEPIDHKAGHIPKAINFPYINLEDKIEREKLKTMTEGKKAYVYCGSGLSATPLYAALKEMDRPVKLYPGSFSEWIYHYPEQIESGE